MIRRLRHRNSIRRHRPGFHSHFGGLWTDRIDAKEELARRLAAGTVDAEQEPLLRGWIERGYTVLKGAVDPDLCDAMRAHVEELWRTVDRDVLVELGSERHPTDPAPRPLHYKLLDLHAADGPARQALFARPISEFLTLLFEREPLLFQSLTFETGSTQPVHQDTAYVVTTRPMELAAAWIALEDIEPGTGELVYYPASHRFPEHVFGGGARNWNRRRDGDDAHRRYLDGLHEKADARGLQLEAVCPRKGDVLLWSADLAHGGGAITREGSTRWSLVGHFCPADVEPYYFAYRAKQRKLARAYEHGWVSSSYYPVT